ncbi:hypothetical protein ACWXV2_20915, partial [Pantoea ananatis]
NTLIPLSTYHFCNFLSYKIQIHCRKLFQLTDLTHDGVVRICREICRLPEYAARLKTDITGYEWLTYEERVRRADQKSVYYLSPWYRVEVRK